MPPPARCDIAIVGGGLGGLALAMGLRRRGFDAHIFEAAPSLRTATSTLIGLGANAFKSLESLHPDVLVPLKAAGVRVTQTKVVYQPKGAAAPRVTPNTANDMITIRWAETQRVLASLVPAEAVHCGHRATGFSEGPSGGGSRGAQAAGAGAEAASHPVSIHFQGQPDVHAQLVVAADGVRSAIRAQMFPGEEANPRYLGHMNWNALLYNPGLSKAPVHEPGEIVVHTDAELGKDFRLMSYLIDAGGGYTFWQVRLFSEQPSFTTPLESAGDGAGGEQEQVEFPEGGGADDNGNSGQQPAEGAAAGGASGSSSSKARKVVSGGMGMPGSKARVVALAEEYGWTDVLTAVQATPEDSIFERMLVDRRPLPTWVSAGGRVVLLGDAAHAMHPGPGQGARQAFEDADQLCLALERFWPPAAPTSPPPPEGLEAAVRHYDAVRVPRTTIVQQYAAGFSGLGKEASPLKPQGLSPEQTRARMMELSRWINQYPDNMLGDPASTYWTPEAIAAIVGRSSSSPQQ